LFNVKNTNLDTKLDMKNYEINERNFKNHDPVENYFECLSSCDISDGICISKCVELLKNHES